ncbi:MAG TPA: hypothetical protein VFO10_06565 [Oligoflexus sp.]|uniref:hypothetical protein n=1 Tax=Oligoflexus sp. TaxID=1971216 RepID=UPI002D810144|nr:hypothetical protein [Oligoflexus sp.]HET9236894.1 hypothetical protein [Oligoflexus sp.]
MRAIAILSAITAAALATAQAAYSDQIFPLGEPADKTDGLIKSFCLLESVSGQESKSCMDAVNAWAGEEIVASCAEEQAKALAKSPGVKYMDMVNGGVWHTSYRKDKDGSDHRHDWSDGMREEAGQELGTRYVTRLREKTAERELQNTTSADKNWSTDGNIGVSGKLFGTGVDAGVGHERGGSSGTEKTVTQKGPTQAEIDSEFARGYKEGYKNPQKAGIPPDVACEKGQPTCYSSNGNVKNEHPKSDPPPTKEPTKVPPRVSSDDSSKPDDTKTVDASDSSNKVISDNEEAKKPDTAVSTVANDGVLNLSPMQLCVAKAVEKKFGKNGGLGSKVVVQTDSSKTPEELKKINTQMLKMGICDETYWGKAYCTDYLKKLNYGLGTSVRGVKIDSSSFVLPRQPQRPLINPGAIDLGNPENFDNGPDAWNEGAPFPKALPCSGIFSRGCLSE